MSASRLVNPDDPFPKVSIVCLEGTFQVVSYFENVHRKPFVCRERVNLTLP